MKVKSIFLVLVVVALASNLTFAADDGPLFTRNISRTPDTMTGATSLSIMPLYVPAQDTQGEAVEIEYLVGDKDSSTVAYTRTEAKPLIVTYNDGIEEEEVAEGLGILTGAGFGEREAFAALSLDDGATWKNYNLSDSASRSSFVLANGHDYPGDVFKIVHVAVDNRVLVAWISRYCASGAPLYSWLEEEIEGLRSEFPDLADLYVTDLFGVGGSQKSVNYTLQGFPEVGEVPYGCVWTARGTLEQALDENGNPKFNTDGDAVYDIAWRQAERLTSGRRDANRVEISGTSGAGFIISWQEDPEGLRPGKGLGPGAGWSGAIVNSKTDIWYTFIHWDHFESVCTDDPDSGYCTPGTLADHAAGTLADQKPKIAVPLAMPMRLTDNNNCDATPKYDTDGDLLNGYCYYDFDTGTQYEGSNPDADLCASTVWWETGGGNLKEVCVAEDGRVLTGKTGSCRVRWVLKPYTKADGTTSAWVAMAAEKMKGLGSELDEEEEPIDIGKDMWYYTFDMFQPELVGQGLMLNSPAKDPETGAFFDVVVDQFDNEYYETEISRRFNLMVQPPGSVGPSGTSAILIYKEGIINQGGPADIFIRRVVLPEDFDAAVDNPFGYDYVVCEDLDGDGQTWILQDGSNPNYLRGLCMDQGYNVSATTPTCEDGTCDCTPFDLTQEETCTLDKVVSWEQTVENLDDPSWENPFDVSKGHRGFIDGDYIMMMYASSPNWKANTTGNDKYNLYIRRSFDGGLTWTTLPASYTHTDGVTYSGDGTYWCEYTARKNSDGEFEEICYDLGPGEYEPARNVSRMTGNKITVLDPRYTPSGGMLKESYKSLLCYDDAEGAWVNCGYDESTAPYPEEIRDPSTYFVTYETGDNTIVDITTAAVPLDMYYSRAFNWGDDYDVVEFTTSSGQLVERWDWLENGPELATEASVTANPDGSKFYAGWNQELEIEPDVFTDMDVEFRRIFYALDPTIDGLPTAYILLAPSEVDYDWGDLTFIGTGQDNDHVGGGIVDYEWTSNLDGVLSNRKAFTKNVSEFSKGVHTISFTVLDAEDNWSLPTTTLLAVGVPLPDPNLMRIYLPMISR